MARIDDIRMPGAMSMNLDVDLSLVPEKAYRSARNVRNGVSSADNLGGMEAVMGNTIRKTLDPNTKIVGRYVDLKTNSIYIFCIVTAYPFYGIFRYNISPDTIELIFFDPELNFSEDYPINHIDFVDGKILYWTDKYNPPRKLNVVKGYNYFNNLNVSALDRYFKNVTRSSERVIRILDQITHPPLYSPTKFVGTDSGIVFSEGYGSNADYPYNTIRDSLWQFRYRYVYDEHQKSVWSPCSKVFFDNLTELANGVFHSDQTINNVIGIQLNTGSEEVNYIEIAYRTDRVGKWKLVDRLYKYDTIGNVLIGSEINYVFKFYNNTQGEDLDQKDVNTDFHLVPKLSGAQAIIEKNRLVHANILEGDDSVTPIINLKLKFQKRFENEVNVNIPVYKLYSGTTFYYRVDMPTVVYLNAVYAITIHKIGTTENWTAQVTCEEGDTPTTMMIKMQNALNGLDYIWIGNDTVVVNLEDNVFPGYPYSFVIFILTLPTPPGWDFEIAGLISFDSLNYGSFKAGSWQEMGLRYFDRGGRACSVSSNDGGKLFIPYYPTLYRDKIITEIFPIHQIMIDWEISHRPPLNAVTYRWLRKKNSIEYFLNFYIGEENIKTVGTKSYLIINPVLQEKVNDIWKNSTIEQYVWQKGDRIRFYAYRFRREYTLNYYLGAEYDFEIVGVEWGVYDSTDFGYLKDDKGDFITDDFGNKKRDVSKQSLIVHNFKLPYPFTEDNLYVYLFEIYRNRKELGDEDSQLWHEFSEEFPVINPGSENRYHGMGYDDGSHWARNQNDKESARGTFITGDVYLKMRNSIEFSFPVESQWYSDFFLSNLNDDGKVTTINKEYRERWFPNLLRYGGLFIQESYVNELTSFIGGDLEILGEKFGEINLIKESGYTLKVRCANKIVSLYIGRAGLQQANVSAEGGEILVASERILGTQYIPNNTYGCIRPESEVTHGNDSYFIDIVNGHILRESKNGIISISKLFGVHSWTKSTCDYLYNQCNNVRIVGGYNEAYDELWYSFYGTNKTTGAIFAETIVFYDPELSDDKGWKGYVDLKDLQGYPPDFYASSGMRFFTLLKTLIAEHDVNALRANFYGIQYYPSILFVFNAQVNREKVFKVISYDGEQEWHAPNAGDVKIPSSYGNSEMWSMAPIERIKSIKGIKYIDLGRNMLSTSDKPNIKDFVTGQELRGRLLLVNLVGRNPAKSFLRWIKTESVSSELTG